MLRNDILYQFCKQYTDKFEECEQEVKQLIQEQLEKGLSKEEIREEIYENGQMDIIFSKTGMQKAALQALIVDDFVKELDEDLQMAIIMECTKQMMER